MRKFRIPMISNTPRKHLHELADQLPADATWDDAIEEARFRKAVETGLVAANHDAFATEDEVRSAFTRWNVKV